MVRSGVVGCVRVRFNCVPVSIILSIRVNKHSTNVPGFNSVLEVRILEFLPLEGPAGCRPV